MRNAEKPGDRWIAGSKTVRATRSGECCRPYELLLRIYA